MFTKDYAKLVLSGQKKLLKRDEVKFVEVTHYDELSVKNLYDKLIELEGMRDYFPVKYPKGRYCERDYMFNVANTLHQKVVTELTEHALKQRFATDADNYQRESIKISEHWSKEL